MPRGRYKKFLDPESQESMPRSTMYRRQAEERRKWVLQPAPQINAALTPIEEVIFNEMQADLQLASSAASQNIQNVILADNEEAQIPSIDSIDYDAMFATGPYITSTPNEQQAEDNNTSSESNTDVEEAIIRDHSYQSHDPYLSTTLCPCSPITRGEVLLMTMTLALRHSLTWIAVTDILAMINAIYNRDVVPATKFKLFKHFSIAKGTFGFHVFCPTCGIYIAKKLALNNQTLTCNCGISFNESETSSFFLTSSFENQLRDLLTKPDIVDAMKYRYNRRNDTKALKDIYDGRVYRKLATPGGPLSHKWNLSYTFNTDGCQAANSSKSTIWPIYIILHQLPPKMRAKNMLLVGIWVNNKEPNMNVFLQPFVDEANKLSSEGITWKLGENEVTSKVFPLCCSVDSVARPALLNMKQFNGYYGCTFCEHPAENIDGNRKYPISSTVPPERTNESIKRDMMLAHAANSNLIPSNKKQSINGVWGPSCLMNLQYFDLRDGMAPDSLHAVLIGVTKQYTDIILTPSNEPWYVGSPNLLAIINARLMSIRPPKCITRTPRSLCDKNLWKASEWRSWLIFYSLVCLDGILPKKYLDHLALFVTATNILLQEAITPNMLDYAEKLIIKFVVLFQQYFGKCAMTFNVHLLLHLIKGVADWGPLWTHDAFPFENENRHILEMKKSPAQVALQISRRFLIYRSLSTFSDKFPVSIRALKFCTKISDRKVKICSEVDSCSLIGAGRPYKLTNNERACLGYNVDNCQCYQKMIYNGFRFTSESYKRCKKTDDSIIVTKAGCFGIISNICKFHEDGDWKVVIFIRDILMENNLPWLRTTHVTITHINKYRTSDVALKICSPKDLHQPCVGMKIDDNYFVSTIPRGCLGD